MGCNPESTGNAMEGQVNIGNQKIKLYWNQMSQPSRAMKSFLMAGKIPHEE